MNDLIDRKFNEFVNESNEFEPNDEFDGNFNADDINEMNENYKKLCKLFQTISIKLTELMVNKKSVTTRQQELENALKQSVEIVAEREDEFFDLQERNAEFEEKVYNIIMIH